jgi:hypothetical protein
VASSKVVTSTWCIVWKSSGNYCTWCQSLEKYLQAHVVRVLKSDGKNISSESGKSGDYCKASESEKVVASTWHLSLGKVVASCMASESGKVVTSTWGHSLEK